MVGRSRQEREETPVDVVYTWVDGQDPAHQELRAWWLNRERPEAVPDDIGAHRFQDCNTLRWSLRSLEKYAGWTGHVYLVTNGQLPAWLDATAPGITLVPHDQIFEDPSHLPTFNSHAIETNLHRIPGLSQQFLYLNDDFLFGDYVTLSDFYDTSGVKLYLRQGYLPKEGADDVWMSLPPSAWALAILRMSHMFHQRYGRRRRHVVQHVPYFFDQRVLRELCASWSEVAETSSHRFRQADDFVITSFGYASFLMDSGMRGGPYQFEVVTETDSLLAQITLDGLAGQEFPARWETVRPKFIYFEAMQADADYPHRVDSMMSPLLPDKSRFELA